MRCDFRVIQRKSFLSITKVLIQRQTLYYDVKCFLFVPFEVCSISKECYYFVVLTITITMTWIIFFFEQILVLDSWVFWFRFFHMNWFTTIRLKWISESVNQLNYCIQLNQKQIIRPKIQKSVFSQSEDVFLSFFFILYKDLCLCLCYLFFYLYHSLTCNGVDHKREKEFINTIYPQFIVLFPWIFLFLNFHCPYELVAQTLNS